MRSKLASIMLFHPYPTGAENPYLLYSPFGLDHAAAAEAPAKVDLLIGAAAAQLIFAFGI